MAYTVSTASQVMTERIEPVLRSAFLIGTDEEAPTFDLFMKGEKERTNELGRRIPIRVTPNASYGSITEGGQLPLAGTPEIVQLRIYYLNQFMMGEINRAVLDQATESDLIKFMRTPMEDDQRTFRRIQNLWMHGTGSGSLGVVTAAVTGAGGTVTFGGDYGAENIIKGARLVFYSSAGAAHATGASVSTVTGIAGDVVTFDNVPTDVVATDTAHYYGSKDLAPHGIPYHVSETSSTYLGVNTATYGGIKSTIVDAGASGGAGGTALTPGMLDLMEAKRRRRSGANASRRGRTYISHTTQEFNYRQLGYTTTYGIQRVMSINSADDRKFDLAIGKASHNGANWILDNQAPKSAIWDLHLPDWAIEYVKLPQFYDDGNGNRLWMKSGSGAPYDALQYAVFARYDLLCKNRANQSAIINLPYIAGL
jgi:hypothetical protein